MQSILIRYIAFDDEIGIFSDVNYAYFTVGGIKSNQVLVSGKDLAYLSGRG